MPNPAFGGQFGPENKLIEGQPNEYDVISRNASVLAFHVWSTIFAGAPFRLQNICRNSVPPRSRTTTLLVADRPKPARRNRAVDGGEGSKLAVDGRKHTAVATVRTL